MAGKLIFFDIDGTIWDRNCHIPPSTAAALSALKEAGHQVFLCSGRTRGHIQSRPLLDLGWDGIVSGCGTMIEYHGETVYLREIPPALAALTVETVWRYGIRPILEGKEYLYLEDEEFAGDSYAENLKAEPGVIVKGIRSEWGRWEICKLACDTKSGDPEGCMSELEPYYDFVVHSRPVLELVPKAHSKGSGIVRLCRTLGVSTEDTVAFGDSMNDRTMLQAAGLGIAMGNADEIIREEADYVTDTLERDGVYKACLHFGLIK